MTYLKIFASTSVKLINCFSLPASKNIELKAKEKYAMTNDGSTSLRENVPSIRFWKTCGKIAGEWRVRVILRSL